MPDKITAQRDRLIHILVVHFDMFRDKAEQAADLFLHDQSLVSPSMAGEGVTDDLVERLAQAMFGSVEFDLAFDTDGEAAQQTQKDEAAGHFDYGRHVSRNQMLSEARRVLAALSSREG